MPLKVCITRFCLWKFYSDTGFPTYKTFHHTDFSVENIKKKKKKKKSGKWRCLDLPKSMGLGSFHLIAAW